MLWLSHGFEALIPGKTQAHACPQLPGSLALEQSGNSHLDLHPVRDLQKVHAEWFIAEILQKRSVNQHVSKFILLGISSLVTGFITSSTTDLQRWKINNLCITKGGCLCRPSVVTCKV